MSILQFLFYYVGWSEICSLQGCLVNIITIASLKLILHLLAYFITQKELELKEVKGKNNL